MNEADILQAMRAIQQYLQRTPGAADTAIGIHHRWVVWTEPVPLLAVTEQALQRLEQDGEVERHRLQGGTELWRRRGGAEQDD
jgi:hypothetical protein